MCSRASLGATGTIVGNEASPFNPPDLSAGPDNTKLVDELGAPFLEGTNVFGAQVLPIVSMHARVPLLGGEFHGVLRQTVGRRAGARNPHNFSSDVVGITAHARDLVGEASPT
jgi:hypothetical protein